MIKYVTPTITCGNFTKGKHYKIMYEYSSARVLIEDDAGETAIVRIDGEPSSKLDYEGKFNLASVELNNAINMAERAANLASQIRVGKAFIGDAIITSGALKPSGEDWVKRCERLQDQVNELIAVNEEVRKILRCPDGFDVRKQAQVVRTLADTLIDITK